MLNDYMQCMLHNHNTLFNNLKSVVLSTVEKCEFKVKYENK